jgi:hypothetical protein
MLQEHHARIAAQVHPEIPGAEAKMECLQCFRSQNLLFNPYKQRVVAYVTNLTGATLSPAHRNVPIHELGRCLAIVFGEYLSELIIGMRLVNYHESPVEDTASAGPPSAEQHINDDGDGIDDSDDCEDDEEDATLEQEDCTPDAALNDPNPLTQQHSTREERFSFVQVYISTLDKALIPITDCITHHASTTDSLPSDHHTHCIMCRSDLLTPDDVLRIYLGVPAVQQHLNKKSTYPVPTFLRSGHTC